MWARILLRGIKTNHQVLQVAAWLAQEHSHRWLKYRLDSLFYEDQHNFASGWPIWFSLFSSLAACILVAEQSIMKLYNPLELWRWNDIGSCYCTGTGLLEISRTVYTLQQTWIQPKSRCYPLSALIKEERALAWKLETRLRQGLFCIIHPRMSKEMHGMRKCNSITLHQRKVLESWRPCIYWNKRPSWRPWSSKWPVSRQIVNRDREVKLQVQAILEIQGSMEQSSVFH